MKKQKTKLFIDQVVDYTSGTLDSLMETGRECEKSIRSKVKSGLGGVYHTLGLSTHDDVEEVRRECSMQKNSRQKKK